MAQFKFKLEGVLDHREQVEQEKQRIVALLQADVTRAQNDLNALDREVQQTSEDVKKNHMTGTLNLAFLAAHRRYLIAMQKRAIGIAQTIAQAQQKLNEAQKALAAASVQKKIIEKLKEKQGGRWKSAMDAKELAQQDEIAMQISYRNHVEGIRDDHDGSVGAMQ